ncbi:MAG TPA: hypothetical protein VGH27_18455 [Streptosporangiaceae bacterium]
MPTMGAFSVVPPSEPWNAASPNVKMPPSAPTGKYPWSSGERERAERRRRAAA